MRAVCILSCVAVANGATIPTESIKQRSSGTLERRADGTATVNLAVTSGTPAHLGDGFIYGFPDNSDGSANTAIPNSLRAGPASTTAEPAGRLESFLSNYRTCRLTGARFQLLVHDLWGADSVQGTDFSYPGDNDDWYSYDTFLGQVISFIKSNNMQDGLELDLWNEPDSTLFWNAPFSQYLDAWTRSYQRFRSDLPSLPIVGPSISVPPSTSNTYWTQWMSHVKSTSTVPDTYTYHLLETSYEPREAQDALKSMLNSAGLSYTKAMINEYGAADGGDQSNAGSVWFLAGLERQNIGGLRAHWGSGEANLHNGMAGLVNEISGSYVPAAQWWVYNYYSQNMTGSRVQTTSSGDRVFDVYATRGSTANSVKIITGLRPTYGVRTYDVTVTGLSAVGITGSSVNIRTYRFTHEAWNVEGPAPTDLGVVSHDVSSNSVTFFVTPDNQYTAYAFEFTS